MKSGKFQFWGRKRKERKVDGEVREGRVKKGRERKRERENSKKTKYGYLGYNEALLELPAPPLR